MVQGLRLCSFTAEHLGSIPGQGAKIPPNAQYRQEKKKKKKKEAIFKNWLNTEVKAERSSLETERKGEEKLSRWGKRFSGHKKPQLRR